MISTKINDSPSDALIICTKDRPTELAALLRHLRNNCMNLPRDIIVVDSSDSFKYNKFKSGTGFDNSNLVHIKSLPGLPHQRNVGVNYLFTKHPNYDTNIFFLDDDCLPSRDFFVKSREILSKHSEVGVLGGFDTNLICRPVRWIEFALGLRRSAPNNVSKGGFGTVITPDKALQKVLWAPGFAQVIRAELLRETKFEGRVRMYGEDVDMHLRLGRFSGVYISNELSVKHEVAPQGRDRTANQIRYESAFRWRLSEQHPQLVKKGYVISSSIFLMLYKLVMSIRNPKSFSQSVGFGLFLIDVIRKNVTEQHVSHSDWKIFNT